MAKEFTREPLCTIIYIDGGGTMNKYCYLSLIAVIFLAVSCGGEREEDEAQDFSYKSPGKYTLAIDSLEVSAHIGDKLFELDDEQSLVDLLSCTISEKTRKEFELHGYSLSDDTVVLDSPWIVVSKNTENHLLSSYPIYVSPDGKIRVYSIGLVDLRIYCTVENNSSSDFIMSDCTFWVTDMDENAVYHEYEGQKVSSPVKVLTGGKGEIALAFSFRLYPPPRGEYKLVGNLMGEEKIVEFTDFILDKFSSLTPDSKKPKEIYRLVKEWGEEGRGDGQFTHPRAIALDRSGNIYVADGRVQKFTSNGIFLKKWDAHADPTGIAVDRSGNVYVSDCGLHKDRILKFTSDGAFIQEWGGGSGLDGEFGTSGPRGVVADSKGDIYVSNWGRSGFFAATGERFPAQQRIQKFTSDGIFLKKWGTPGNGDGEFVKPCGLALDRSDNVYVCDTGNHRIQKFTSDGVFLTKWGGLYFEDGFSKPVGLAIDDSDNLYVPDTAKDRIQKFTSDGVLITEWGEYGKGDGQLISPEDVVVDRLGNVYVADTGNNRIQKFVPVR